MKALPVLTLLFTLTSPWSVSALAADGPPEIAESKLEDGPEGLRYHDLVRGEGEPLQGGTRVPVVIELWTSPDTPPVAIGAVEQPLNVVVGGGSLIRGLDIGLVGMRVGGQRYVQIPAALTSGAGAPMEAIVTVLAASDVPPAEEPEPTGSVAGEQRTLPGNRGGSPTAGASPPPLTERRPPDSPPTVNEWSERKNGLRVADLVDGTGEGLVKGQTATVEYTGWVVETGERFDSSLARADAFRFTLGRGQVILGWDKGLRGMKVGGTRVLKIPAYLAYGASGAGSIPPHADLVFQVQLLEASPVQN